MIFKMNRDRERADRERAERERNQKKFNEVLTELNEIVEDRIEKFKQNNPNVIVKLISNEKNRGIGYNHRAAAREASGKYLMMITGDSDEPAHELKKIISNIGKADMIFHFDY